MKAVIQEIKSWIRSSGKVPTDLSVRIKLHTLCFDLLHEFAGFVSEVIVILVYEAVSICNCKRLVGTAYQVLPLLHPDTQRIHHRLVPDSPVPSLAPASQTHPD
jgi:hypothetical protein